MDSVAWGKINSFCTVIVAVTRNTCGQDGARTPWARLVGFMAQENRGYICEQFPLSWATIP